MAGRDPVAVSRFVEQFAASLADAGLQRMAARVFAALYATDSGRLTAAELAETLQVSPAAISGAVHYLLQFNMIRREREPGSRRDSYVVDSETWFTVLVNRDQTMLRWEASARQGVEALGAGTPAGERMAETYEFFAFLRAELTGLLERWQKYRISPAFSRSESRSSPEAS